LLDGPGGTGKPVGGFSIFDGQGFPAFGSGFVVTPGARSVDVTDSLDNFAYIDNIVVTVAAPEPGSMLLSPSLWWGCCVFIGGNAVSCGHAVVSRE
jgi:hypothetical protein